MKKHQIMIEEDVVVLTSVEERSCGLLSLEANLLERGIFHASLSMGQGIAPKHVLHEGLKALLVDEDAFRHLVQQAEWKGGLEEFSRRGGFLSVFRLGEGFDGTTDGYLTSVFYDTLNAPLVEQVLAYTGVRRNHPEARARLLSRDVGRLAAGERARVRRWVSGQPGPSEFFMHYGRSIGALLDAGDDDLGPMFEQAIKRALDTFSAEPLNHDALTVLYGPTILARRGFGSHLLKRAYELLLRTVDRRPKYRALPSGSGFGDEPLAAFSGDALVEGMLTADAINGFGAHDVISNEMLHFHAPTFAAMGRLEGDDRLASVAVALCDHVYTRHAMENGLLHHISRDGEPAGWAWGRGQTHALYGLVYTMEELEPDSPELARCRGYLDGHLHALRLFQDGETGLWRNLVDSPDGRVESSCSLGIGYAIARGMNEGWITDPKLEKTLDDAWAGVRAMMHKDGLAAMCRGTLAGESRAHYLSRPQGWGRVAQMLMFILELARLGKAPSPLFLSEK